MRYVVFAGHGSYARWRDDGRTMRVPPGMTVVFWVHHGETYQGSAIDRNPHRWQMFAGAGGFQQHPGARAAFGNQAGNRHAVVVPPAARGLPEVYPEGTEIPYVYRLTPPTGLNLGAPPAPHLLITVPDRNVTGGDIGYPLDELLLLHRTVCAGATIHWAACRVERLDR